MKIITLNKSHITELENEITKDNCSIILNIIDYIDDVEIDESSSTFGLLDNNKLVGAIELGYFDFDDKYEDGLIINNIAVFDEFRGRGYGNILISKSLKLFNKDNYKKLYADALHEGLFEYYDKLGFKQLDGFMFIKDI